MISKTTAQRRQRVVFDRKPRSPTVTAEQVIGNTIHIFNPFWLLEFRMIKSPNRDLMAQLRESNGQIMPAEKSSLAANGITEE